MNVFLIQNNKTVNVTNPCQLNNTIKNHTISVIRTSCVVDSIAEEVFGFRLNPSPELSAETNVSFIGTGNFTQCLEKVRQVFDMYSCRFSENCDSNMYEVPPVNGTLVVSVWCSEILKLHLLGCRGSLALTTSLQI